MRENQSIRALLRVIPAAFNPSVQETTVLLTRNSSSWALFAYWLGEGFPADVKRLFNELEARYPEWRQPQNPTVEALPIPVLVARKMSSGARQLLEAEEISWADTTGRASIIIPGEVYISRLPPIPSEAVRSFKWSFAAGVVAEWVLSQATCLLEDERSTVERVNVIAQSTGLSMAHVGRILRSFDEQQYTIKTGAERGSSATREFRDLGRLLSDWAAYHVRSAAGISTEFTVPWREPDRTITLLETALDGLTWAVTGAATADLIAPYLTSVPTVDIYVNEHEEGDAFSSLCGQADFTEVPKGGRVRIFTTSAQAVTQAAAHDGVRTMSSIRVYADLLREGGRAVDAAEYLRETNIGF